MTDGVLVELGVVNDHDRPLAFYPFTNDKRLAQRYVTEVLSGSVGVSGMGLYHGYEVFLTFSKLRPVFRQGRFSSIQAVLQPPYRKRAKVALHWMFKLRGWRVGSLDDRISRKLRALRSRQPSHLAGDAARCSRVC